MKRIRVTRSIVALYDVPEDVFSGSVLKVEEFLEEQFPVAIEPRSSSYEVVCAEGGEAV